jgi:hypothetical protein
MSLYIMDSKSNPNTRKRKGGEAVASGGFGCVFRPALKCEGEKKRQVGNISKFMKNEYADDELEEVNNAKNILRKIPNYSKYFALYGYNKCVPDKFTDEDLKKFRSKCRTFSLNYIKNNFNKNKDIRKDYAILNSPDLGISVSDAIEKLFNKFGSKTTNNPDIYKFLIKLNNTSVDTLKNGIKKMSDVDFYHSDVKQQNVMTNLDIYNLDKSFEYMKLIDFGLALPEDADEYDVNGNFLFNYPFSSCLYSYYYRDSINRKLNRSIKAAHSDEPNKVKPFLKKEITNFVNMIINDRIGHMPYILHIGQSGFNMTVKDFIAKLFQPLLIDYLTEVIIRNYTKNQDTGPGIGKYYFDDYNYWRNVYRFNLDVWGFLQIYYQIANNANNRFNDIREDYISIIKKYVYNVDYANKTIPVNSVIADINKITKKYNKLVAKSSKIILTKKPTNKTKKNLVIVKKLGNSNKTKSKGKPKSATKYTLVGNKCPNGFVRHKTMRNKCIKKVEVKPKSATKYTLVGKKCPKGFIRHKTMRNKCVKK